MQPHDKEVVGVAVAAVAEGAEQLGRVVVTVGEY